MGSNESSIEQLQDSCLRELTNIGLGHATMALASLTGQNFNMDVPSMSVTAAPDLTCVFTNPEELTVAVSMPFTGDVQGQTAFFFPWASAQRLSRLLTGLAPADLDSIDELFGSTILEVGNILCSSFLNAISDMTGLRMEATPPAVSIDGAQSIVSTLIVEACFQDTQILTLETRIFEESSETLDGRFLCMPASGGLQTVFERLGVAEAA
ncbi:MAG: chemotaxis protein CheC [Fimbriimonadaceae bacterium]|mgnify:CR=1 FL=1|nr:chemotaxis protein CheC [Fimbriimonadaceae bacterium]QYK57792.1 MAG: chemotaxis protein CheC [Fimbriimonadaceae bacterium]